MIKVRVTSAAAARAIGFARGLAGSIRLKHGRTRYRPLYGFLFRVKQWRKVKRVDIIDLPVRVIGDQLEGRPGGGIRTTATVLQNFPRDLLYDYTGAALEPPDPDLNYDVTVETAGARNTMDSPAEFFLAEPPGLVRETLVTYDNAVQGGAPESARVITRVITDKADLQLGSTTSGGTLVPPDMVYDEAKLWLEVETCSVSGSVDRIYISEDWVKSASGGYRLTSTAVSRGVSPMPIAAAYRRGDRLVVAVNVRKQTAPYSETSVSGGDWSAANNRDYGYSGLLIVDGVLLEGAYVPTRSRVWELETESDQRLVPMRWHNEPAPYNDQVWALYQGVASNDIRPSVVIDQNGDLFGCAVVNVTRTAEQGDSGFISEEMLGELTPAQALVYWEWPVPSETTPFPQFVREVKEAYLHFSGAKVWEGMIDDQIAAGSGLQTDVRTNYPWLELYPRTAEILERTPVPASPDPAAYRQYMEQESELFIESFTLASTDDETWQLSVVYHRFKMASIGQVNNVPLHQPGMICAADLPNNTQVCVTYPTLYKRIELPDWVEYTWDGTGLKVNRYPFLNQSTYIRGVPYAALGVDATTVAASRGAVMVEPGQWAFYGYPFDSLDINTFRISLMNDDGVTHVTPPPDEDLPGAEVNVPRIAGIQRQITGEDESGTPVVTKQFGLVWTPGTRGFVTNTSADKWARIYTDNLGQIAFVGNSVWSLPQGQAAEIPGDSNG